MTGRAWILRGDVGSLPFRSGIFDALLSDPPYGLSFMGRKWDHGVPSVEVWTEVLRCLKPGAYMLTFGGTRTAHRLTCAIEDAGADIRDRLMYMFGTGFPKNHAVDKAIDRMLGAEREVVGVSPNWREAKRHNQIMNPMTGDNCGLLTESASPEAKRWEGWGSALKPAYEPIVLARKPLDGTMAANCLEHGCGALNVDGGRIETYDGYTTNAVTQGINTARTSYALRRVRRTFEPASLGRWPANVILDTAAAAMLDEQSGERRSGNLEPHHTQRASENLSMSGPNQLRHPRQSFGDDSGVVSRFFYTSKASRAEREAGLADFEFCNVNDGRKTSIDSAYQRGDTLRRNRHPTCKPLDLCRYLATLLLPPPRADGGPRRILVPFSGSGSEMIGCLLAGWDEVVGVEMNAEYTAIAQARVAHWQKLSLGVEPEERDPKRLLARDENERQTSLLGLLGASS